MSGETLTLFEAAETERVPPGYKQTAVGVIPEDWEVRSLDEVAEFLDRERRPVKDSDRAKMRGIYPYYGASGIIDYVNDYLFDDELVLLGEDGENILSRNRRLAFRVEGKFWVNNHAHVLRPKAGFDTGFLTEYLESLDYELYNTGTAQPKLNREVCGRIPVAVPSLSEQRAMAAALSDVDGLISSLDRLITKKRAIKTAAMQQLLTGKRRLPGFSGEWETTLLGSVCLIVNGGTPSTAIPAYWDGDIEWCTPTDITADDSKYLTSTARTISDEGLKHSAAALLPQGSLLLCTRATVGELKIATEPVSTNQGFKSLVCGPDTNNEFLYYKLLTLKNQLLEKGVGSTFLEVSKRDVASLRIPLPSIEEQRAIATVLSDMDTDISALEARREKTRQVKQGMMQELLTGRTRLVPKGSFS